MQEQLSYSISDLRQEFGLTSRSIRFYEDEGLLTPEREGSNRVFSRHDRVQLILILRGKRLGFSIAEIREMLSLWDDTTEGSEVQLKRVLDKIAEKRSALDQQLRDIAILQLELDKAESRCDRALTELNRQS